jgi:hypothetical protein
VGNIRIELAGSFGNDINNFSARQYGHARAISDAIKWLNEKLPRAIRQDHDLHGEGVNPENYFGTN